ncbi:hypothetical protein ARMSODRAFT_800100 [Armillaria solidipes]|uniref:Uncharacterized protein n=1 Tax=Armillaria solidipes TaxID=1076256 RepID=A0A2H3AKE5_9AGAR|nr:hypothetical protein ARMSODRAFT_800100 [Armillaria solidipes]
MNSIRQTIIRLLSSAKLWPSCSDSHTISLPRNPQNTVKRLGRQSEFWSIFFCTGPDVPGSKILRLAFWPPRCCLQLGPPRQSHGRHASANASEVNICWAFFSEASRAIFDGPTLRDVGENCKLVLRRLAVSLGLHVSGPACGRAGQASLSA